MAQQQRFYLIFGVIAVAALGWLGWKVLGAPDLPVTAAVGSRDTTGFQGYVLGSPDAPVEIVEYADFQCPACAGFDMVQFPDIKRRLIETGKARFVHRDYPFIPQAHPHGHLASHAAACADDQGLFWEMKDRLYRSQGQWTFKKTRGAYETMGDQLAQAGGNRADWETCMESGRHAARIQASLEEGARLGVNGTPTFLINGQLYGGASSDEFVRLVDSLIAAGATPVP